MKKDKFGQAIYPLTEQKKPTYDRLMREYPEQKYLIEQELLEPIENRDWTKPEKWLNAF